MPPRQPRQRAQRPARLLPNLSNRTAQRDRGPEPRVQQPRFQPALVEDAPQQLVALRQGPQRAQAREQDTGGGLQAGGGEGEDVFGVEEGEGGEEEEGCGEG